MPTKTSRDPNIVFAVDMAKLAREVAQDIFDVDQIVRLHQLDDLQWAKIQAHPTFQKMLGQMTLEWNAAGNTRERIKIKAQTGLEATLEVFIRDACDASIPLAQRVEAGKFLARLGELDNQGGAQLGTPINISIVTSVNNAPTVAVASGLPAALKTIEGELASGTP